MDRRRSAKQELISNVYRVPIGPEDRRFIRALGAAVDEGSISFSEAEDTFLQAAARDGLWDYENDGFEEWASTAITDAAMAHELDTSPNSHRELLTVSAARKLVQKAVIEFFSQASTFDPEGDALPTVHAIRAGVGIGKTHEMRMALARRLAAMKLAAMRSKGDMSTCVIAVPTHKLGDEQARDFEALPLARANGLRAAPWRGREAPDPLNQGKAMCRDLGAVRDAQSVGAPVESSVCKRGDGTTCPFFGSCGYQRQKLVEADVWIVAHEMIFSKKPAALGDVAALIVDEAAWQDGLMGVGKSPDDLTLDALRGEVTIPKDHTGIASGELNSTSHIAYEMLTALPDGPLKRSDVLKCLSRESVRSARLLTWRRKEVPDIRPGMSASERRALVGDAASYREISRTAQFFGGLESLLADDGPEASGWVSLATKRTPDGSCRVIRLKGRRTIGKGWRVPTLILDATFDVRLAHPYWPQVQLTAEAEADAPHMHVRQMTGQDWAKSALVPADHGKVARAASRIKNSDRLRAAVLREARMAQGRTLVVAQKAVEEHWRTGAAWPACADLAHFNALAGRDEWGPGPDRKGVALLIVAGRTSPKPGDVERLAEALTGTAIAETQRLEHFSYPRVTVPIHLRSGREATGEADRHPHPIAEAIRWQICEGELIQVIGRGRGVNRTAANPLEVLILTNRPLPLLVDELVPWDVLAPGPVDLMMAAEGVALENQGDMAQAYPTLWPSREAAKKAVQRGSLGTNPFRYLSKGECPQALRQVSYQVAGPGKRPTRALFDPAAVPDIRIWLEERLGPLATCDVEEAIQPAATAPEPILSTQHPKVATLFGYEDAVPDVEWWDALPEALSPEGPGLFGSLSTCHWRPASVGIDEGLSTKRWTISHSALAATRKAPEWHQHAWGHCA